jgi:hypothetical protein
LLKCPRNAEFLLQSFKVATASLKVLFRGWWRIGSERICC